MSKPGYPAAPSGCWVWAPHPGATAAEESIIGNSVNELVAGDIGQAAMTGLDDIPTDLQRSARLDPSRPGSSRGVK